MKLSGSYQIKLEKQKVWEALKKGIEISDLESRKHVYGMPYSEWKEKYKK